MRRYSTKQQVTKMIYQYPPPPYYAETRRQTFRLLHGVWDIDKAIELTDGKEPNACVNPKQVADCWLGPQYTPGVDYASLRFGLISVNPSHALSYRTDTSRPVIMAKIVDSSDGPDAAPHYVIIDGWHRIWRGRHDGLDRLDAYLLTDEEERACRLRGDWDKEGGPKEVKPKTTRKRSSKTASKTSDNPAGCLAAARQ